VVSVNVMVFFRSSLILNNNRKSFGKPTWWILQKYPYWQSRSNYILWHKKKNMSKRTKTLKSLHSLILLQTLCF